MFAGEWNALSQPNSRVVGPCGVLMGGQDGSNNLPSPTAIANGAAWYDLSDTTSLIKDSSDRIQLISDKSGNSGTVSGVGTTPTSTAMVIDGSSGAYASAPSYIPGSGIFRVEVETLQDDYTPTSRNRVCGVWDTTGDNRSWSLGIETTGALRFAVSDNGELSGINNATSDAFMPDGTRFFAASANTATGETDFEISSDGVTWTALGTQQTYTTGLPYSGSTADLAIGAANAGTGDFSAGEYYSVKLYFNGASVFDADFVGQNVTSQTFTESEGETVTLNGTARWSYGSSGGTNALELPGVVGNYASFTALSAFGTGDLSVSAKVKVGSLSANQYSIGSDVSGFGLKIEATTGKLEAVNAGVGGNDKSTGVVSAFQEAVIGYSRNGTTGTYYIDGVGVGTITDTRNYSVGVGELGTIALGTLFPFDGNIKWARVYDAALDATAMAADAAGTVQANNIFNVDFGLAPKLATSVTALTGQTVTINQTSIALPARIHGARDLYQGLSASQPTYLGWSGTNYGYLNGVSGNYFSTPASAALTPTTEFEVIAEFTRVSGEVQYIIAQDDGGANRAYYVSVNTSGTIYLYTKDTGGVANFDTSTANLPVGKNYIKVTTEQDNGSASETNFYTGTSRSGPWTLLGSTVTGSARLDIVSKGTPVTVGNQSTNYGTGKIDYVSFSKTIGGAPTAVFNPADYPATGGSTFTSSSTGETWTINGGAHIVTRTGAYFNGTSHYMKTAPFPLEQPENLLMVLSQLTWTATDSFIDGNNTTDQRMKLGQVAGGSSPQVEAFAQTATSPNSNLPLKTCGALFGVLNGASSLTRVNRTAAVTGNVGSLYDGMGVTLGAKADGTLAGNIFASEIIIYDTVAQDTSTQDRLALYAGRKWRFSV